MPELALALACLLDPPNALERARAVLGALPAARLRVAPAALLRATRAVSRAEARRVGAAFTLAFAALERRPRASAIDGPEDLVGLFPELGTAGREEVWLLHVDGADRPIARELVARGGPARCDVAVADVVRSVLAAGASGVYVVHNHPSGDPTPSARDVAFTDRLDAQLGALGLTLRDHVVLAGLRWASCASGRAGRLRVSASRRSAAPPRSPSTAARRRALRAMELRASRLIARGERPHAARGGDHHDRERRADPERAPTSSPSAGASRAACSPRTPARTPPRAPP
ncbi:MAG: JAB domain-containing protein [Deltaproteobacteria bacterium]|nr:JAB domain-containing protein [Deltaproteobacteria bacterium]